MTLINEFVEKAKNNTGSFSITIDEGRKDISNYRFLQGDVGKARYIYGMRSWNNDRFYSDICLKPELVAIVSDGKVYVVDEFFLQIWQKEVPLPENTIRFDEKVDVVNEFVSNVIFTDFYNSLEVVDITREDILEECRNMARKYLFSKTPAETFENEKLDNLFSKKDVANILCGFMDADTEARKRLEADREKWISQKSLSEKIRDLMSNPETASDWELKIAEGLRCVNAKTVVVEFEMNGKRASGKMTPETIISNLRINDNFDSYDFEVSRQGEEILKNLGAENHWRSENALRCKHITKITYGKKELYVKNI